jgi:peroxiredoxin
MSFTLQLGAAAPHFDLPGVDGRRYSLASFADAKVLVVAFTCNHCPYVVNSEERIIRFDADYAPRGVRLACINANEDVGHPEDSFERMVERARSRGFRFPYLRDETQDVALAYGALRTPHFFVFDEARRLRYTGRMDDSPRVAGAETTHELRDAVAALLEGRTPPVEVTNPIGCNVKWRGRPNKWMPPEACDLV